MDRRQRAANLSTFNQDVSAAREPQRTEDGYLAQVFADNANIYMGRNWPDHKPEQAITADDVLSNLDRID